MTKLVWDAQGSRFYETGTDRGVLYPNDAAGVPWNGLISVEENTSGGDLESYYIDGFKYLDYVLGEDFQATLTAFSAPSEFGPMDGNVGLAAGLFATLQPRQTFGLSYRTKIGNDVKADEFGYKIHLIYNSTASPSTRSNKTKSDSPEALQLAWTINCVPPSSDSFKPTAHLIVDSTKVANASNLTALENALYGTSTTAPRLPTQTEVITLLGGTP